MKTTATTISTTVILKGTIGGSSFRMRLECPAEGGFKAQRELFQTALTMASAADNLHAVEQIADDMVEEGITDVSGPLHTQSTAGDMLMVGVDAADAFGATPVSFETLY